MNEAQALRGDLVAENIDPRELDEIMRALRRASPVPPLSRRGTVTFVDDDRRTARFDGTFEYIDARGRQVSGQLTGAFMQPDRIWFRFQDENLVIHEGDLLFGIGGGEIFFQGLTYETTGATYSLRVR